MLESLVGASESERRRRGRGARGIGSEQSTANRIKWIKKMLIIAPKDYNKT